MAGNGTLTASQDKSIEVDVTERYVIAYGTVAFGSANNKTYNGGGTTLSFAGVIPGVGSAPPVEVKIWSESASLGVPKYVFDAGSTIANGVVRIYGADGAAAGTKSLVEFADGTAWNDAALNVWGDTPRFAAKFLKGR